MTMLTSRMAVIYVGLMLITLFCSANGVLEYYQGDLVDVVDKCTPGLDASCNGTSVCCVKEALAYPTVVTGPRPVYQIVCKPYRHKGEFCYSTITHEFCRCADTLSCSNNGNFYHCQ